MPKIHDGLGIPDNAQACVKARMTARKAASAYREFMTMQ
jgi:hypothetical protein